jgi:tRNA(Ile2) C34 agmatinyltransferase TiaS
MRLNVEKKAKMAMYKCKKCCKNLTCNRKQCNFIRWIQTKNYGVPRRIEDVLSKNVKETEIKNTY